MTILNDKDLIHLYFSPILFFYPSICLPPFTQRRPIIPTVNQNKQDNEKTNNHQLTKRVTKSPLETREKERKANKINLQTVSPSFSLSFPRSSLYLLCSSFFLLHRHSFLRGNKDCNRIRQLDGELNATKK